MRSFLKFLAVAVAAVVTFTAPISPVSAQAGPTLPSRAAVYLSNQKVDITSDPWLYIKYVGTAAVPLVNATLGGNIVFTEGGVADATVKCPVGAAAGTIDTTNAACDTLGEIVDVLNSETDHNWVAVVGAALRTDTSQKMITNATCNPAQPTGCVLYNSIATSAQPSDIPFWGNNEVSQGIQFWSPVGSKGIAQNPFRESDTALLYGHFNVTNAGTVGNISVYCVVENNNGRGKGSEVANVVYLEAGAATTVTGKIDEFLNAGGLHCQGGKMFVREAVSGAATSAETLLVTGYQTRFAPSSPYSSLP